MSETQTTSELTDQNIAWLKGITQLLEVQGFHAPAFPLDHRMLFPFFGRLGYRLNDAIVQREHGEMAGAYTVDDVRRLHGKLERMGYWLAFPNPAHDAKKPTETLAHEVAEWLETLSGPHRLAFITAADTRWLLILLAAAIDPDTQATLLVACTHKANCSHVTSPDFWPGLCDGVAMIARMIENEPGSKAHQ